jgi:branched-chain amino acid transport system substrate-binding protein
MSRADAIRHASAREEGTMFRRTVLRRWWTLLAVALVSAFLLGACGDDDGDEEQGAGGPAAAKVNPNLKGEFKIGAVFPTTGDSASIGEDQIRGAELATAKVNSEDGVLGKKLEVSIEDTQSDTVAAGQAARKLVSVDKVPLVVGEYISARTIAAGKYLNKTGVVQINPGSSSTDITGIGPYSFSSIALDNIAGEFTAKTLYDAGYRRIAFLGPNNPYGAEFARVIKESFTGLGGEITESILYTEGESTYRAELERMQGSDPELYVYASYVPDTKTINEEAFELGIEPSQMFGIYLSIDIEDVDPAATAGQQGMDLTYGGQEGKEFAKAYEDKYGQPPRTPYSAYVYDAVLMAAKAINRARSDDPDAIRDALEQVGQDFPGATGSITLDKDGQRVEQEYGLFEVDDNGEMKEVGKIKGPES